MKDGIISAKQANETLETSRKKRYEQILTEIQEKLDEALKDEKEYFRAIIPAWCEKDMIAYLRQMGYEVVEYRGEVYSIVFGKKMLKELAEKERERKLKRNARITAIVIFLGIVCLGYVTYGWPALVVAFLIVCMFVSGDS